MSHRLGPRSLPAWADRGSRETPLRWRLPRREPVGLVVTTGGALAGRAASEGFGLLQIPPGPQPRAAFGYLAGGVLRVLEAAGVVGPQAADLNEAAAVVQSLLEGDGPQIAEDVADRLAGRFANIYGGSGPAAVAANRWKTQINENSKAPAAWIPLPVPPWSTN